MEGRAAWRQRQRHLRSWWRREQQSVAAALATFQHHSAPRRQRTARAGGGYEVKYTAKLRLKSPPPPAAGAVCYEMDTGEDDGSAPAAGRPAPLLEVLPQEGTRRHTGSGYELVLEIMVPQLGWAYNDVPGSVYIDGLARVVQKVLDEREGREHGGGEARSSNKMPGRRKRKKRRKKKLLKASSSTSSRRRAVCSRTRRTRLRTR